MIKMTSVLCGEFVNSWLCYAFIAISSITVFLPILIALMIIFVGVFIPIRLQPWWARFIGACWKGYRIISNDNISDVQREAAINDVSTHHFDN